MTGRPITSGLAVLAAAAALSACGGGEPSAEAGAAPKADAATVTIKAFDFQPDPITVEAGTPITFVNTDQIHHTATAGKRGEATPDVFNARMEAAPGPGQSVEAQITLDEPGTYDYFCKFHPGDGMVGKIVVR